MVRSESMDELDGDRIRTVRKDRGMTLKQLAEKSGVSASQISQIERGQVMPTLSVFWKVCRALEVPLNYFFGDDGPEEAGLVVRKDQRKRLQLPGSQLHYQLLTPDLRGNIEFLLVEIEPGQTLDPAQKITHLGEECGYVQQGELTVLLGEREYTLQEGDSIHFRSSVPHRYANRSEEKSISIWAMTPPSF